MKCSLHILVADIDAEEVLTCLVRERCFAMKISLPSFKVGRLPAGSELRGDSGMFRHGARFVRNKKADFDRVILLWDHHGSGPDTAKPVKTADEAAQQVQQELHDYSWKNRALAVAIAPELERWIWTSERWIEPLLKVSPEQIQQKIGQLERSFGLKPGCGKVRKPKELWRECFRHFARPERDPRSGDLALAIKHANIDELRCESFAKLHDTLCTWFPADNSF